MCTSENNAAETANVTCSSAWMPTCHATPCLLAGVADEVLRSTSSSVSRVSLTTRRGGAGSLWRGGEQEGLTQSGQKETKSANRLKQIANAKQQKFIWFLGVQNLFSKNHLNHFLKQGDWGKVIYTNIKRVSQNSVTEGGGELVCCLGYGCVWRFRDCNTTQMIISSWWGRGVDFRDVKKANRILLCVRAHVRAGM